MTEKQKIRAQLDLLAEPAYQVFSRRLLPEKVRKDLLGVRLPHLRRLARRMAEEDFCFPEDYDWDTVEEKMLFGMLIGYKDLPLPERLALVEKFVPMIDNWAVCDCVCSGWKFAKHFDGEVWNFLQRYRCSKKEYEQRFFLVMLLNYFIDESHLPQILSCIEQMRQPGYYAKMAAAWLLAECFCRFPEQVRIYLECCEADDWVYNKALQKICDSYRVTAETKAKIKKLKRKERKIDIPVCTCEF